MTPKWYLQRLASMGPMEIIQRTEDAARRRLWRSRPPAPPARSTVPAGFVSGPSDLTGTVTGQAAAALVAEADGLLAGRWTMFGRERTDMTAELDYFVDFVGGTRAPDDRYSLTIDHRDEGAVGNIKFVWEPARHHHLTILAAAYSLTGDDRYAERVEAELGHYWATNPFLTGIHWTSGIELGIRLISWTWTRRLLDGWEGASALFEDNPVFVDQLGRHHQWLSALGSHGSSANNHVIAEAAGQFVAATAFPLFRDSGAWQAAAAEELAEQLAAQTFPEGLNRELASDYHGLVLELGLVALVEATLVDHPVASRLVEPIGRAVDALYAVVDIAGQPHRQGDSDDANGWLLDPTGYDRWSALLRTGALVVEPASWWVEPWHHPTEPGSDVRSAVIERCLAGRHDRFEPIGRRVDRPGLFPNAGLSLLRADAEPDVGHDELWVMFDHGPLGFLATAAHGHADALAVEVRCGGVEIVADPGTYCYHGEPEWRDHFRSTRAHATVTLADRNQSEIAGPFLWRAKAEASLVASAGLDGPASMDDGSVMAEAVHDGYEDLGLIHRRRVVLDRAERTLTLVDTIDEAGNAGGRGDGEDRHDRSSAVEVALPLGPGVEVTLEEGAGTAWLRWDRPGGECAGQASVTLDPGLSWSVVQGVESPPAGWYSARFGTKVPAPVLLGRSPTAGPGVDYTTIIGFLPQPPGGS